MDLKRKIYNLLHPSYGRILMLHRVLKDVNQLSVENQHLEITNEKFIQILNDYQQNGWQFISIDEVYDVMRSGRRLKHKFVCFTFDDGYRDTFEVAYPILKERQIPFCVYVTPNFYEQQMNVWWYKEETVDDLMMSSEQIKKLSEDELCTIGAHTMSHPHLSELSYQEQMVEIRQSKLMIEDLIGKKVEHFAYPYGDYNIESVEIVKQLGFKTVTTCSGRLIRKNSKLLELGRIFV